MTTLARLDRDRILRTLTFWLRPGFVLRTLNRFQRIAGFDRAIALASSAFTALVPLTIVTSAVLPRVDASKAAQTIINRYGLTGGGAKAVRDLLSPAGGAGADVTVLGGVLLVFAVLSFSRGMQRLFEQTWELKPLSVRNTLNDLGWIGGLVCCIAVSWWIHALIDHGRVQIATNLVLLPASAIFLAWSGWILSARRVERGRLAPFAILGAALLAIYLTGAAVYLPHLFSSYASRYGVIGAVLAMISALFGTMVVLVASAAVGREVFEELGRIRRGERPPDDEVRSDGSGTPYSTARARAGTRCVSRSMVVATRARETIADRGICPPPVRGAWISHGRGRSARNTVWPLGRARHGGRPCAQRLKPRWLTRSSARRTRLGVSRTAHWPADALNGSLVVVHAIQGSVRNADQLVGSVRTRLADDRR